MSKELEDLSEVDCPDTEGTTEGSDDSKDALVTVVGVKFRHSKTLWFDPKGLQPQLGDKLIVTTERGTEIGDCVMAPHQVKQSELPAALKPVLRIATEDDLCFDKELQGEERAAILVFRDHIAESKLDIKPTDVEILFGKEKMIFYFSAEERIDFRHLVRDLSAHFDRRVEMRQIGVRDEACLTGGIGHCGEILCCTRLGGKFEPVSIKMAKEQGLPLNPSKISGTCGRLMCCLRYEVEAYKDFNKRAPKKGALIDTPRGCGKVVERDVLRETVKLQFDNKDASKPGETMTIPVARMCCNQRDAKDGKKTGAGCGGRPCAVAPDVFAQLEEESKQIRGAALSTEGLNYRGLEAGRRTESAVDNGTQPAGASRPSRRRGGRKKPAAGSEDAQKQQTAGKKRPSRRRGGRKREPGDSSQERPQEQKRPEGAARGAQQGGGRKRRSDAKKDAQQGKAHKGGKQSSDNRGKRPQKRSHKQSKDAPVETRVPRRRRQSAASDKADPAGK
ncbi:MAG: tpl protein [Coriobacteriia bacterium]|nr:tpl protein [Coriobacteriia bacterium]